jgi:putative addiction module killer protein
MSYNGCMVEVVKILVYKTDTGKSPFDKWLEELDIKTRAIIRTRLARVRGGNFGDCKALKNELWELKINYGPGYRIYFAKVGTQIILLTNAGDKSSQNKDIEKAIQYLSDYKERNIWNEH